MIDWQNLTELPVRRRPDPCDWDRLRRPKRRNHPKRHGENRERSRADAAKAARGAKLAAEHAILYGAYIEAVRAYWRGEIDEFPQKPSRLAL